MDICRRADQPGGSSRCHHLTFCNYSDRRFDCGARWYHFCEMATAPDTAGSATVTYLGINGFQPFASIHLNLPTGESAPFRTGSECAHGHQTCRHRETSARQWASICPLLARSSSRPAPATRIAEIKNGAPLYKPGWRYLATGTGSCY